MQTWAAYRWKIFTFFTCLYIATMIASTAYFHTPWGNKVIPFWVASYYRLLSPLTYLSLALIMQYFKESAWKIWAASLFVAVVILVEIAGTNRFDAAEKGLLIVAPAIFYFVSIFSVRAPAVSSNFKWIGRIFLMTRALVMLGGVWRIHHWPFSPSGLALGLIQPATPIAILVLLLKMTRLPDRASIESEIDAIGSEAID